MFFVIVISNWNCTQGRNLSWIRQKCKFPPLTFIAINRSLLATPCIIIYYIAKSERFLQFETGCPKKGNNSLNCLHLVVSWTYLLFINIVCKIIVHTCKNADSKFKGFLNYYILPNVFKKSLCTGFEILIIYTKTVIQCIW